MTLLLLGVAISKFNLPDFAAARSRDAGISGVKDSVWNHRRLVLGAIGIFVYVGAEVAIGSFLVNYLSRPEIGAMPVKTAARYVSLYWGGAMVGRFVGSSVLQKVRTGAVLGAAAVAAFLLVSYFHGEPGFGGCLEHPGDWIF